MLVLNLASLAYGLVDDSEGLINMCIRLLEKDEIFDFSPRPAKEDIHETIVF